jgi:hypothetical protein
MLITMRTTEELNDFFNSFFENKELECSSFKVQHSLYGCSEMPLTILIESLTNPNQSITFLKEVAEQVTRLDYRNSSNKRFTQFFSDVAQELTEPSI